MTALLTVSLAALLVAWLVAGKTVVRLAIPYWLRHWAERSLRGRAISQGSAIRPQRLIASARILNGLVLSTAGAVLVALPDTVTGHAILDLIVCALLVIAVAEITARTVARRWPAGLVKSVVPALQFAEVLCTPLQLLAIGVCRGFPGTHLATDRRSRVQRLLREAELDGGGVTDTTMIITGVVEFSEKLARDVMTRRADTFAVSDEWPPQEAAEQVARSAYSRVPVYHGSLDHVVGMIHAFDLLRGADAALGRPRPVATATDDTRCSELLLRMLRDHRHLAIVQDRNAHTVGIVSLEDLLEELVGDIRDEHDEPSAHAA